MKQVILLPMLLMFIMVGNSIAQTNYDTISATYVAGVIQTDGDFDQLGESSSCPGVLNVPVPDYAIIVSVDVEYSMTAITGASMNNGMSQLKCTSPNGAAEPQIYAGTGGWSQGTEMYSRTGLDIANGVTPIFGFGVNFELHTGTIYWNAPAGCSDLYQVVDDGTWTVTVIYLPPGSPGNASNPVPADMEQLVDVDTDLTWDFGSNTDTYDVYFGTDNPPTTMVVSNAVPGGATGSYNPGTMTEASEYFWRVVAKNTLNENPGNVWSFTTKCATPVYPYLEGFDGITAPNFPSCWIPLSGSTNQFSRIDNWYDQWGGYARSAPNVLRFLADAEPTPNLVLVFPEVGTISDKVVSVYGMNEVDWIGGQTNQYPIEIGTITDPFDINTFTAFDSYIPGSEWTLHEFYMTGYSGTDTYLALRGVVPQYGNLWVDDITIDEVPSCIKPSDLVEVDVQALQATIGWTDVNGATSWNIEYDTAGFTPGTGTVVNVTSNPGTITGLMDGTYYDIYVQADCGGGDESAWSWPITILTKCLPWSVPIDEDFGLDPYPQTPELPLCWSLINICGGQYGGIWVQTYNSYAGLCIAMDPFGDAASELILSGPELSPAINTLRTSFMARSTGDRAIIMGTMTDPTDETTFTPYDTISGLIDQYQSFTVYFNNYSGTDTYIAWRDNAAEYLNSQVFIDNITIETIPSCVEPYKPWVDGLTANTGMIHWTDPVESGTDWEIEAGAPGFTPGTGTALHTFTYNNAVASAQSFEMTGLSAATTYDAYIRTSCGTGDYSVWVGPVTFLTGFDQFATLPVSEDFEGGMGVTANSPFNVQDWVINNDLMVSGTSSVHNPYGNNGDNILFLGGTFDFTAKTDVMLSFWQIAKTDGTYDHCYVEISTDGGNTYDQLPESTYAGAGNYREEGLYNNPEGPCFDEDSYADWGTSSTTPDNSWWKKEYFNLTDYNTYDNVVIRFRLVSNGYTNRAGWYIDDIAVETMAAPGFNVDPLSITEDASEVMPTSVEMNMGNTGGYPASYSASVIYNESDIFTENFDSGIPGTWTIVNNGNNSVTWVDTISSYNGYDFDGTRFAICDGYQNYGAGTITMDDELISPVIDASAYSGGGLLLEFDQAFDAYYSVGDTARIYVYDGTDWIMIYESWVDDGLLSYNSNGVHKSFNVAQYANANFQVKFHYIDGPVNRGYYLALDNIRLRASMFPLGWLTINSGEYVEGVSLPDADNVPSTIGVQMDATGLSVGTYNAEILVTSSDPGNPTTTVPVTMNVIPAIGLDLTVFLEGPYDVVTGSLMITDLSAGSYLPLDQPYNPVLPYYGNNAPVWLYLGTESVTDFPANTVDWVIVQLRDAADAASAGSGTIIGTKAAFLLSDGSVVGLDGARLIFNNLEVSQNLYVVIYHRNHLGIMSANALTKTDGVYSYDFSTGETQVYGGANGHKDLGAGVWGMISADGDGNGLIQNTDETAAWKVDLGSSGYLGGDFDMNGLGQNTDETDFWKPNLGGGGQIPAKSSDTGYQSQIPK
ncbi:MAG: choice-of-anchor J domain-containing protein [Bacteroidetes bacterium]|nr:choice-of-anchor J domain-containing protein [Bacteroidota bacterium]